MTQDAALADLTAPERAALAADAANALERGGGPLRGSILALAADLHAQGGHRTERAAELMLALAREHSDAGALAAASSVRERADVDVTGQDQITPQKGQYRPRRSTSLERLTCGVS